MLRITNSIMQRNTKNNINLNKETADAKNTQVATGQKISRPSDDPVIAIRALRLNTDLSQMNQYYDKNIPDATAWLKVTETALSQTDAIYTSIKENLTTGASDDNTAADRMKILENLKGYRDQIYASGNADYAGRTVFTGYRTGDSLMFREADPEIKHEYEINEPFSKDALEKINYVTTGETEAEITRNDVFRVRLSYDNIKGAAGDFMIGADTVTPSVKSIAGLSQADVDAIYTSVGDDEAVLISDTGELLIGKNIAQKMSEAADGDKIYLTYTKDKWDVGDLKPEHYFSCTDKTDNIVYNEDIDPSAGLPEAPKPPYVDQSLEIEVSYNQKVRINTSAGEVYGHAAGRDVDDLLRATQDVIDVDEKLSKLKKELSEASEADKPAVQKKIDAANKEFSFKKDKMQKMFSEALGKFDGYSDKTNLAIANIGSKSERLSITRDRVSDQLMSFKELANDNINIELTDAAIDLNSAEIALQAAQLASAKIAQQSLLNYL